MECLGWTRLRRIACGALTSAACRWRLLSGPPRHQTDCHDPMGRRYRRLRSSTLRRSNPAARAPDLSDRARADRVQWPRRHVAPVTPGPFTVVTVVTAEAHAHRVAHRGRIASHSSTG